MSLVDVLVISGYTVLCVGSSYFVSKRKIDRQKRCIELLRYSSNGWENKALSESKLKKEWEYRAHAWKQEYCKENEKNSLLIKQISQLQRSRTQNNSNPGTMSSEEKELIFKAIKKSMVAAHPDKGGNNEEFIKYNKLFKKYK